MAEPEAVPENAFERKTRLVHAAGYACRAQLRFPSDRSGDYVQWPEAGDATVCYRSALLLVEYGIEICG